MKIFSHGDSGKLVSGKQLILEIDFWENDFRVKCTSRSNSGKMNSGEMRSGNVRSDKKRSTVFFMLLGSMRAKAVCSIDEIDTRLFQV